MQKFLEKKVTVSDTECLWKTQGTASLLPVNGQEVEAYDLCCLSSRTQESCIREGEVSSACTLLHTTAKEPHEALSSEFIQPRSHWPENKCSGGRKTWSGLREDHLLLVQYIVFLLCQRITPKAASHGHLWRPCGYYYWHSAGKPRRLTLAVGTMPHGMVYSRVISAKPANKHNKAQRKTYFRNHVKFHLLVGL